jgi:multidrug resistance efflux pump
MTVTEITSKRGKTEDDRDARRSVEPKTRGLRPRTPIIPILITLAAVALAGLLGWAMWGSYMGAPWTRDATLRTYIVTMAPEVAGRIVELPVIDNGYVHKGDLLMVIDPTNYKIAVSQTRRRCSWRRRACRTSTRRSMSSTHR